MKTFKILFTLLFFAVGTALIAQNADEKKVEKADKKIVIIKKTIDEDGNEVVEKIIKEGSDADHMIWLDAEGNEMKFSNEYEFEIKNLGENIKILGDNLEDLDILKLDLKNLEGLDEEIREKMKNMEIEIENLGDHKAIWIQGDENGESFEFKWNDEEMPENIMEELKEKGIHFEHFDRNHKSFIHKSMGHDNKAFLGVKIGTAVTVENINGEETEIIEGENKKGAEILGTIEGSAAEAAGLIKGDIITAVDGKLTQSHETLVEVLGEYETGDKIKIDYIRDGNASQTEATLKGNENTGNVNIWIEEEEEEEYPFGDDNIFLFKSEDGSNNGVVKSRKIIIIKQNGDDEKEEIIVEEIADESKEVRDIIESHRLDLEMINIFPNPTSGILQIQFRGEALPTKVRINDISGKEVYKEDLNNFDGHYNTQIDVSDAAKGTLLLTIAQGKNTFTEKIILE